MARKKARLYLTLLVAGTLMVVTGTSTAAAGVWTGTRGVITQIKTYGHGPSIRIKGVEGHPLDKDGCTENGGWFHLSSGVSQDQQDEIGRLVMSAYLAGKKVLVKVHDDCNSNGRPEYYAVDIKR